MRDYRRSAIFGIQQKPIIKITIKNARKGTLLWKLVKIGKSLEMAEMEISGYLYNQTQRNQKENLTDINVHLIVTLIFTYFYHVKLIPSTEIAIKQSFI